MKVNIYIYILLAGVGLMACDKEAPFDAGIKGEGQFNTAAISLQLKVDETIKVRSRAGNEDLLPDFDVYILNSNGQTEKYFKYGEMPEIVTLPQGSYRIKAIYGEDMVAGWDNPYLEGESKQFEIRPNEITTDIDPVSCYLKNVMVSVVFDNDLLESITGEPQVEVYVNKKGSLIYTKEHASKKTPGYFKHDEVSTLTAEFKAVMDGAELTEIKTLNNIEPGNHYRLTFYKHVYVGDESGFVEGGVKVDARVSVNDIQGNVTVGEEKPLTDVTWPTEDGDENKDDPGKEDPGKDDPQPPTTPGPQISLDPQSTVVLGEDAHNEIDVDTKVILNIHSESGIEKFKVTVESNTLDLEQLGAEGGELDMINPGGMLETLHQLQLLPEGVDSLKGEHDVKFDISGFMELLTLLGEDTHKFIITVGDADGEDTVYLNLTYTKK